VLEALLQRDVSQLTSVCIQKTSFLY